MKRTELKRHTPLRSKTRIKAKRSTPRTHKIIVRLTGNELEMLRGACYWRDGGRCVECGKPVRDDLPDWHPDKYHMAHIHAKRSGGDTLPNVRTLCGSCHRNEHQGKLKRPI